MKRYLDLCEAIIKEHREVFRKLDITQLSQILNELIKEIRSANDKYSS